MGVQETIVCIKKKKEKDFIKDVSTAYIKNKDSLTMVDPFSVVEIKQDCKINDSTTFYKGDTLLLIIGERSHQRTDRMICDALDIRPSYAKHMSTNGIEVLQGSSIAEDFIDERIYTNGEYETDAIKMISIDKYISNNSIQYNHLNTENIEETIVEELDYDIEI